jgi:hypothetical protein
MQSTRTFKIPKEKEIKEDEEKREAQVSFFAL